MRIVTPLPNHEYYEPLVEAGAGEFYCGYIPFEWLRRYVNVMPGDRREFLLVTGTFTSMSSMKILARKIERYNVPVKITLNAHFYTLEQYPLLLDNIRRLMDLGIDTFIVADVAFVLYLREQNVGCNIHLSGEAGALNHSSHAFFRQFDISRYIFPRKTDVADIAACIEANNYNGMEYEAFVLNSLCSYSGAYCNTIHCEEMLPICYAPYRTARVDESSQRFSEIGETLKVIRQLRDESASGAIQLRGKQQALDGLGSSGCGLCKVKELLEVGVTHLKVVGRDVRNLEQLKRDLESIQRLAGLAGTGIDNETFEQTVKRDYLNHKCSICYYPGDLM